VLANPSRALYTSGRLLWVMDDRLVSQPLDGSSLRLSGDSETVAPSVYQGAGRTPAFWASDTGTLVYAAGGRPERQFRWIDRTGSPTGDVGPPGLYITFDLSPDGSRVVTEIARPGTTPRSTLATIDATRGVLTPLTSGEVNDSDPRFGPGGDVVFARNSGETPGILRSDPAGGAPTLLFPRGTFPVLWMEAWSRDGKSLVYRSRADRDAWQTSTSAPAPQRLTQASEPVEQVQLSPTGRWMIYNSAESGRFEVYVSPVPHDGRRWQVSTNGGVQATWRADGRELYYLGLDGALYAVDFQEERGQAGLTSPRRLFRSPLPALSGVIEQYRPAADGQRFLFCLPLTSVQDEPLRVVLNWPARLSHQE
jgi:Tol biopolymer transport system component